MILLVTTSGGRGNYNESKVGRSGRGGVLCETKTVDLFELVHKLTYSMYLMYVTCMMSLF